MNSYSAHLQDAVAVWSAGKGETDAWARAAMKALLNGELTPATLAQSVYAKLRPRNSRGELVSPRMLRGRLSVRDLENATAPVPGAAAARKNLETVIQLFDLRSMIEPDLEAFARGDTRYKLYGLAARTGLR